MPRLAQMQGQRFWIERIFEDAKGECDLADYPALGWRAWHHHVTMVMLAMLFIAEQRAAHKPEGKEALVERINQRHRRRRGTIESRYRKQRRDAPS